MDTYPVFDMELYVGDRTKVLSWIKDQSKESYKYIVTPNVNHLVALNEDSKLRSSYSNASLRLCDSRIVKLFLDVFSHANVEEVIAGSDLTFDVFNSIIEAGNEIVIIGGDDATIEKLQFKYPEVYIHHYNPPMGFINSSDEIDKVLTFISDVDFQYIFFAVGCPRQEYIAELVKIRLNKSGVGFCIGASILFMTGELSRAPRFFQKLKIEWFYRILMEPRRLASRYANDAIRILPVFWKEIFK